jgi:protein-disulfide isomerase
MVYGDLMDEKKKLGFITLGIARLIFFVARLADVGGGSLSLNTRGFPSMGKGSAPIEVVLIEDFQCKNCLALSKKIIPKLQESYIRLGKVKFTLVPVSFLKGSQLVANAALEVKKQAPAQFFPFLSALFEYEGEVKREDILRMARRLHGVNLVKLERCMDLKCHSKELEQNLNWARNLMGARFRTPALYINGAVGSTYSYEAIEYQIEHILGSE